MVVHACKPSAWGGRDGRSPDTVQGQHGLQRTTLASSLVHVTHVHETHV